MPKEAARELTFSDVQSGLGTLLVDINGVGIIFAETGQRKAVATYGLGNCTAIAVQFEKIGDPNICGAIIAHYMPQVISRFNVSNDLRVNSESVTSLGVKAKALIAAPGVEHPQSPTGYGPRETEIERIAILTVALKDIFGEQTEVSKVGYKPPRNHGWIMDYPEPRERGTVIVEYPKEGGSFKLTVDGIDLNLPLS